MKHHLLVRLLLVLFCYLVKSTEGASTQQHAINATDDVLLTNLFRFWAAFRDPNTGLFCDTISLTDSVVCGDARNTRYSSASTGMGLVADCAFAELGLLNRTVAKARARQTIDSLTGKWPTEPHSGFYVHWTDARFGVNGEFSTVDTAEMVMGVLFAGNYYGDAQLSQRTLALARSINWSNAIESAQSPRIYPVVNGSTGEMSGTIEPYNEYFIVAYVAQLLDPAPSSKATQYFKTYFGFDGPPRGSQGHPVVKNYWGNNLLTDNSARFMSSFIPLFCSFLTRGWHTNTYYQQELLPAWLHADQKYFELAVPNSSKVWGKPVAGKVFGAGAGQCPSGYCVNRIDERDQVIFSTAIMAGFLQAVGPGPDDAERNQINSQLKWLYDNDVCTYTKPLPSSGEGAKIMWRCSVTEPDWHARSADSIDFSTFVLGYVTNWLPGAGQFYGTHAA